VLVYHLWDIYTWAIVVECTCSDIPDFYLEQLLVFSDLSIVAWGYDIWKFRGEMEDCSSSLVSSSKYNTVSLGVPFDCCDFEIRWGTFEGEGCIDVLDDSCFVSSGVRGWSRVEDNGQTRWMAGLAWVGRGFGRGGSGRGLASLLACSSVDIGLGAGVFRVVSACTQAWIWRLVLGWLLLVDFGRYSLDFFGEGPWGL